MEYSTSTDRRTHEVRVVNTNQITLLENTLLVDRKNSRLEGTDSTSLVFKVDQKELQAVPSSIDAYLDVHKVG